MPLRVDVVTIFPSMFDGFLAEGVLRIARDKGAILVHVHDLRAWTHDRHRTVDDRPYGGGPGMVMKPEPVLEAVDAIRPLAEDPGRVILLSPAGTPLDQPKLRDLAASARLILVCGRYEGLDDRIRAGVAAEEISIGDYVLSGGEVPAMVVVEGAARLLPGVLGDEESPVSESFADGLLEYPQYTRPPEFRGMRVPEILLSGDHAAIARWRKDESLRRTRERRRDLYLKHTCMDQT